jgi:endonuclease-3
MPQRQTAVPPLPRVPVRKILAILAETYPQARTALDFRNPFELLVATVLSAQCTDRLVNRVTPGLFSAYPDAAAMAQAGPAEIEPLIARCGLFRTKAKNLAAAARLNRRAGCVARRQQVDVDGPAAPDGPCPRGLAQ